MYIFIVYIPLLFAVLRIHSFNGNLAIQTMLQRFLSVLKQVSITAQKGINFISSKEKIEDKFKINTQFLKIET